MFYSILFQGLYVDMTDEKLQIITFEKFDDGHSCLMSDKIKCNCQLLVNRLILWDWSTGINLSIIIVLVLNINLYVQNGNSAGNEKSNGTSGQALF